MLIGVKKAVIYALQADRDAVLRSLQQCGEFMALEKTSEAKADDSADSAAVLKFLARFDKNKSLLPQRDQVSADKLFDGDEQAQSDMLRAKELVENISSLKSQAASYINSAEQLEPWLELEPKLVDVADTRHTRVLTGFCQERDITELLASLEEAGALTTALGLGAEGRALMIVFHADDEPRVGAALGKGFVQYVLPKADKTVRGIVTELRDQAKWCERDMALAEAELEKLGARLPQLRLLYDSQVARRDRRAVQTVQSERAFMLEGWVRQDRQIQITEAVRSATEDFEIEFIDPAEGETPPTFVLNNKVITPFETVTDLYSHPASFDPNFMMAPFYFLFFGMMVSDAGYGLLMTVAFLLFMRFYKPRGNMKKLVGVLTFGAVSTVIWGCVFGGFFAIDLIKLPPFLQALQLIDPLNQPLPMLLLCYALGTVHILTGIFVKIYLDVKQGDIVGAICDQLAWAVLVLGLIMLGIGVMAPSAAALGTAGVVMSAAGALTILFMAGRSNKNILGRLVGGLGSLYGVTSYLSDILSYSRLFALGLATGVIGMVLNLLSGMLMQNGIIGIIAGAAVLIVGHAFNIVINTLGAFVHTARLQYIEFFGKFYEAGGKEFKPLSLSPKYVDIVKQPAKL